MRQVITELEQLACGAGTLLEVVRPPKSPPAGATRGLGEVHGPSPRADGTPLGAEGRPGPVLPQALTNLVRVASELSLLAPRGTANPGLTQR